MKKITNLLLASALSLTTLVGTASATTFTDTPSSHWAYSYVQTAVSSGLMSGTGDKEFSPETSMTYGQFAVVVVNGALGGETTGEAGSHWSDVYLNTLISKGMLKTATEANIVIQTSGWQDLPITREDAASIIVRVMGQADASVKANIVGAQANTSMSAFSDVGSTQQVNGQATDIAIVMANNIMIGSDGKFGVGNGMKRCEAAVVFKTLLEMNVFTSNDTSSNSSTGTTTTAPDTTTSTPSTGTTTTPSTGTTTTTPSTSTASKPDDVVLGSGQYDVGKYTVPADTNKDGWLTNAEVNAVIDRLQAEYPTGTAWGADKAYTLNVSVYVPGTGSVRSSKGCAAWAWFYSDSIFGDLPARRVVGDLSLDPQEQIRAGDVSYSSAIVHWGAVGYSNDAGTGYLASAGNTAGTVGWANSPYSIAHENLVKYTDILYGFTRYPEA